MGHVDRGFGESSVVKVYGGGLLFIAVQCLFGHLLWPKVDDALDCWEDD